MIPKENLDLNRDRADKNIKSQIFLEENRIFGKDLKNSQNNSFVPQLIKPSLMEKISAKNVKTKNFKNILRY